MTKAFDTVGTAAVDGHTGHASGLRVVEPAAPAASGRGAAEVLLFDRGVTVLDALDSPFGLHVGSAPAERVAAVAVGAALVGASFAFSFMGFL